MDITQYKRGQTVSLTRVFVEEFRGLKGIVKRTVEVRDMIEVEVTLNGNLRTFAARPENIDLVTE